MTIINLIPRHDIQLISCSQNDTTLRKWQFKLMVNNQDFVIPENTTAVLECSNGGSSNCVIEDNIIHADCNSSISSKDGKYYGVIKLENGNKILHTARFFVWVQKRP